MIGSINNATDVYASQAAATAPRAEQAEEALRNAPGQERSAEARSSARLNTGEDTVEISGAAREAETRFAPPQAPEDEGDIVAR